MLAQNLFADSPSMTTVYLKMKISASEVILATGTGFIYERNEKLYLITNGHNVTGVNPETKRRLSENHCGFPDCMVSRIKTFVTPSNTGEKVVGDQLFGLHPDNAIFPLYEDEDFSKPLWLIHPEFGYDVDVIALYVCEKLQLPTHINLVAINSLRFDNDVPVAIADDVFVLGYPYDLNGGAELPIWKKGSVATEPSINFGKLPKLLIDTATRPGMSGSPVIFQRSGIINKTGKGGISMDTILGTVRGFLGVYSGRINSKDMFEAQLGIVWKEEVISQIIDGNLKGTTEFQSY